MLLMCTTLLGCTSIEDEPLLDEDGNLIPTPGPYDYWLDIEDAQPTGDTSLRPTIELKFNAHLEDDDFIDFNMAWLASGGIRASGLTSYRVRDRTLVFRPYNNLIEGLRYRLIVNDALLESVTGAPADISTLPLVIASSEIPIEEPEPEPDVAWPDVRRVFERKCWSCHQDPSWQLNPLTRESMIGTKALESDELLVIRYDPADSYLMHKVIPDYPIRRYGVQPPTWSDAEPLTETELALIEDWIRVGAP